jgi:hypothetical protein
LESLIRLQYFNYLSSLRSKISITCFKVLTFFLRFFGSTNSGEFHSGKQKVRYLETFSLQCIGISSIEMNQLKLQFLGLIIKHKRKKNSHQFDSNTSQTLFFWDAGDQTQSSVYGGNLPLSYILSLKLYYLLLPLEISL